MGNDNDRIIPSSVGEDELDTGSVVCGSVRSTTRCSSCINTSRQFVGSADQGPNRRRRRRSESREARRQRPRGERAVDGEFGENEQANALRKRLGRE